MPERVLDAVGLLVAESCPLGSRAGALFLKAPNYVSKVATFGGAASDSSALGLATRPRGLGQDTNGVYLQVREGP